MQFEIFNVYDVLNASIGHVINNSEEISHVGNGYVYLDISHQTQQEILDHSNNIISNMKGTLFAFKPTISMGVDDIEYIINPHFLMDIKRIDDILSCMWNNILDNDNIICFEMENLEYTAFQSIIYRFVLECFTCAYTQEFDIIKHIDILTPPLHMDDIISHIELELISHYII